MTLSTDPGSTATRIVVFSQAGSGDAKIKGIRQYGRNIEISQVVDLPGSLPGFIDDPEEFLPTELDADLVLSFLKHPDLNDGLAALCRRLAIPLIISGKKTRHALTPFTCCGLGHHKNLGAYGEQFGVPELTVRVEEGIIVDYQVRRGASCGATWQVREKIMGLAVKEALTTIGREVQYLCFADPSAFDPVTGKSALHFAGEVHNLALKNALQEEKQPNPTVSVDSRRKDPL